MSDEFEKYKATNFIKPEFKHLYQNNDEDEFSQYRAENFRKKTPEEQGFFNKLPRNIATGVAELGRGLANAPHNLANLVGLGDRVANLADPEFDYGKAFGLTSEPTLSDKLIQGITQFAPAFALPGANLGRAGEAIGAIPKAGQFLKGASELAVPQATFGATQNNNPLMGALEGGAGSIVGSAAGSALEKGINALRPSKMLRGKLTPKQLKQNVEANKGVHSPLGRIIESPSLNFLYENTLPHFLGSGTYKQMDKAAKAVQERGQKLINDLSGDIRPENYGEKIKDALIKSSREVKNIKNEKFAKVNALADAEGITTSRSNFTKEAKDLYKQMNEDPHLIKFVDKSDRSLIQELANSQNNEQFSLKSSDILRGKIGDKVKEAYKKGEENKASIYIKLKNALEKDVGEAIEGSSNEELKNAHKEAMDYYRNDYAQYKDKDIRKFINEGGDPDLIVSHFIRGGKNDRATLLKKISKAVRQQTHEEDNILANSYLSKALNDEGELNPVKFSTLYHKLGVNQRKALFGKEGMHEKVKDYVNLVDKNKEAFNNMYNPKTGHRNTDFMIKAAQILASKGAGGGIPGFVAPLITSALLSKGATKLLSSPKYREKLVNAMLKNKNIEIPKTKEALQKGAAIAAGLSGQDKEQKPLELLLTKGRKHGTT